MKSLFALIMAATLLVAAGCKDRDWTSTLGSSGGGGGGGGTGSYQFTNLAYFPVSVSVDGGTFINLPSYGSTYFFHNLSVGNHSLQINAGTSSYCVPYYFTINGYNTYHATIITTFNIPTAGVTASNYVVVRTAINTYCGLTGPIFYVADWTDPNLTS